VQNIPPKGCGLGHVIPKLFGIQSNISSKLHELETSNLVPCFPRGNPKGGTNNFPEKGRGQVTPQIFGIVSNISSKLLQLETSTMVYSFVLGKPGVRTNNFP